jgi:hypothetical protein
MTHNADSLRVFLEQVGLPKSGTKTVLRERLSEYLAEDFNNAVLLTEHLNLIEGWGNQQLYLYTAPIGVSRRWRSARYVETKLAENGVASILNRPRAIVLPDEPTLACVQWTPQRVRFIWNKKREWFERREDEDRESPDGDLVFHAFERKTARGTLAFDWHLETGESMIMIQRLPSGTHYNEVRDEMARCLAPFVDLATFETLRVGTAIKPILRSGEVRGRAANWETLQGGRVSFTSPGMRQGIGADETLRRMEAIGGEDIQGRLGNMYWLPPEAGVLTQELHAMVHKKDQRVGIMGEKLEEEVRYVVGRIRAHCD